MELWAQSRTDWSGVLGNCTQCSFGLFRSLFPLWTEHTLQVSDCRLSSCEKSNTTRSTFHIVHYVIVLEMMEAKLRFTTSKRLSVYSGTNYCSICIHSSSFLPFFHCKEIPHLHHFFLSPIHVSELINHLRRGMTETETQKCSSYKHETLGVWLVVLQLLKCGSRSSGW